MTDPAASRTDAWLRRALADGVVTLDPSFQGLPETAHGGSVLALFDAIAGLDGMRTLRGTYHRRVPLAAPLSLAIDRDAAAARLRLSEGATLLVDGVVTASDGAGAAADTSAAPADTSAALALPISRTCFACGIDNPLGLRAALVLDEAHVRTRWIPRKQLRDSANPAMEEGTLATVALTTLLDEAAFWLGAAASGESGMTTTLRVDLLRAVPFGEAVTVAGSRAGVAPRADDPRYWDTEVAAWDDAGRLIARANITFVAVRGAARKLVTGLLAMNPPDTLRRVFPAYVR